MCNSVLLSLKVSTDGVLKLLSDTSSAFVDAYSADADTSGIGSVFYRQSTDPTILSSLSVISSSLFFNAQTEFTSFFVVTWFQVGYFQNGIDRVLVDVDVVVSC